MSPLVQKKILVIDDEKEAVELVADRLRFWKYEVLESYSGQDALQKIAENKPDLILLDIRMPGMDGFEVCKRLKKDDNNKNIPVIMFTAQSERECIAKATECGAQDYLAKPYEPDVLLRKIRMALRK
ncbi:response regulator [Candidatus Margulisiibacteriota bacterium]